MGVPFHHHKVRYLDGTCFRYPAKIISSQVNKHQMFGTLFFIRQEFIGQRSVFLFIFSSWSCTGNGAKCCNIVFKANHDFG